MLEILEFYLGILEFLVNSLRNSRIPYYVILGLDQRISIWNSKFICNEILGLSRGMTQGLGILEFLKIRHCEDLKKEGAISLLSLIY